MNGLEAALCPRPPKTVVESALQALDTPSTPRQIYYQIQWNRDGMYDLGAIVEVCHSLVADGVVVWQEQGNVFSHTRRAQLTQLTLPI